MLIFQWYSKFNYIVEVQWKTHFARPSIVCWKKGSMEHFLFLIAVALSQLPLQVYTFLKLCCHIQFKHAENTCVLRTKDTYIQSVQWNSRFILSNQGKNAVELESRNERLKCEAIKVQSNLS
jgi:hypothetical protein